MKRAKLQYAIKSQQWVTQLHTVNKNMINYKEKKSNYMNHKIIIIIKMCVHVTIVMTSRKKFLSRINGIFNKGSLLTQSYRYVYC
jgi:uncharacterized membrane protein YbaN (DUF454 family)